ncbi:DUF3592 domain-containing protein [Carnobacterium mobile]|uniref:DUF3592 domain-containing protein n=1 Tax=Carnobacterium mobile TaxID=2750 RepID=UPI00068F956E|nr:DUF3592 domain-containing protein [Carnobacterium mobile]
MRTEDALLVIVGLLAAVTVLFLTLGMWLYLKNQRIKNNSVDHVLGKVVGYSANQSRAPIVEYEVNGRKYKSTLRYSAVITTSSTFNPVKSEIKGDLLATKLRIRNNSVMSVNTIMQESFPIGSRMNVYYNPDKPKESFVERFAPSYVGMIFMGVAVIPIVSVVLIIVLS